MSNDIKDYRNSELKSYVIGNILLVIVSSGLLDKILLFTESTENYNIFNTLLSSTILSSIMYIYIFLADSVIPSELKERIIWLFSGLPGERVFSDIKRKCKDTRFSSNEASELYKEVYKSIKKADKKSKKRVENHNWYLIYKKYESHEQILTSQRDYLLCRDLVFMTFYIFIGYIILQISRLDVVSWKMIGVFIVEFAISWVCACIKGRRFVYNVIALDIAKNDKVNS